MGCISSRTELTIEEATSYNQDLLLGYSELLAQKVYETYLYYSLNGRVSTEEFTKVSKKLDLFNVNQDFIQPILNFFGYFKTDLAHYSLQKLLVFGIIQSRGSTEIKAGLLFDAACEEDELSPKMIKDLFRLIFDLVLKMLTGLKVKDFVNGLTQDDMKLFQSKLSKGIKGSLKAIMRIFDKKKNMNRDEFIKVSHFAFADDFFTGHGIRTFLKKHSEKNESIGLDN